MPPGRPLVTVDCGAAVLLWRDADGTDGGHEAPRRAAEPVVVAGGDMCWVVVVGVTLFGALAKAGGPVGRVHCDFLVFLLT